MYNKIYYGNNDVVNNVVETLQFLTVLLNLEKQDVMSVQRDKQTDFYVHFRPRKYQ